MQPRKLQGCKQHFQVDAVLTNGLNGTSKPPQSTLSLVADNIQVRVPRSIVCRSIKCQQCCPVLCRCIDQGGSQDNGCGIIEFERGTR